MKDRLCKKLLPWILLLCISCFCAGCSISEENPKESTEMGSVSSALSSDAAEVIKDKEISIYYLNKEQDGYEYVEYALTSDDPVENAKIVLEMMAEEYETKKELYRPALRDFVKIVDVKISKDHILNIDFSQTYNQLTMEEEALSRCAVVSTLVQIPGIDKVTYSIDKAAMMGEDGIVIDAMDQDSFYYEESNAYGLKTDMTLYYATGDGKNLIEILEEVISTESMLPEQAALQALFEAPKESGVISPLPDKLEINKVQIMNNVCYVDLSEEIEKEIVLVSDEVMVYAMVNTIVGLGHAASVEFTVNGNRVKSIREFTGFDKSLTFNFKLCE